MQCFADCRKVPCSIVSHADLVVGRNHVCAVIHVSLCFFSPTYRALSAESINLFVNKAVGTTVCLSHHVTAFSSIFWKQRARWEKVIVITVHLPPVSEPNCGLSFVLCHHLWLGSCCRSEDRIQLLVRTAHSTPSPTFPISFFASKWSQGPAAERIVAIYLHITLYLIMPSSWLWIFCSPQRDKKLLLLQDSIQASSICMKLLIEGLGGGVTWLLISRHIVKPCKLPNQVDCHSHN